MDFKYPYTDFHELNLDWFLAEFKKLTAEWLQMQEGWADEQQAFQDLKEYINSYFADLDVQEEINNKLDAMALSGQLGGIMSPYVTAELPSVVAAQLAPVVASQISAVVAGILPTVVSDQMGTVAPPVIAEWLADHIDPGSGYAIDNTLTVQNAAADAKAAGDRITDVNNKVIVDIINESELFNQNLLTFQIDRFCNSTGQLTSNVSYPNTFGSKNLLDIMGRKIYLYAADSRYLVKIFQFNESTFISAIDYVPMTGLINITSLLDPSCNKLRFNIRDSLVADNSTYTETVAALKIYVMQVSINNFDMITDQNIIWLTGGQQSSHGIDVTTTPEGYFKFNGTATSYSYFFLNDYHEGNVPFIKAGTYYYNRILISGTVGDGNPSLRYGSDGTIMSPGVITFDQDTIIRIRVGSDSSYTDAVYAFILVKIDKAVPYFNRITAKDEIARGWIEDLDQNKEGLRNAYISMYEKIAVCGASWDSGYYYIGNTVHENSKLSWIANLARKNGVTYSVFARHSLYTKTWLTSAYGLPAVQAADPQNLYILTFGGKDSEQGQAYLGSISDITDYQSYTLYADTFYGNYGRIIEQILEKSPKAQIIMIMYNGSSHDTADHRAYYAAAAEIAAHYGLPFLNWADDPWYASDTLLGNLVGDHPTPVQLSGIAGAFERLFSKAAVTYYSYFKTYNPT